MAKLQAEVTDLVRHGAVLLATCRITKRGRTAHLRTQPKPSIVLATVCVHVGRDGGTYAEITGVYVTHDVDTGDAIVVAVAEAYKQIAYRAAACTLPPRDEA